MTSLSPCPTGTEDFCSASIFLFICLAGVLVDFFLSSVIKVLEWFSIGSEIPQELDGIYDEEKYRKSQAYSKENIRLSAVISAFSLCITLTVWFTGTFGYLDVFLRKSSLSETVRGISYMVILYVVEAIISFPFSLYSIFVIEEKYGFNKTTVRTLISDILKGTILAGVVGIPILTVILILFSRGGEYAWLYLFFFIVGINLVLAFLAPVLILPFFFKLTPLEDGELREAILDLANKADFAMKDIYVIDGSKRSSHSNAFFTGFGSSKRICLFDTLIEQQTTEELVGVIGHEIGHYKKGHIWLGMLLGFMELLLMLFLLSIFISSADLANAFYVSEPSVYFGLVAFGILAAPVQMILGILGNYISRQNEYAADRYGAKLTERPESLANALKKLAKDNLSNLTPPWIQVFVSYSHPTVLMRVRALNQIATKQSSVTP
mmetsp:Transcript_12406/g.16095  ORF Transcript_12406/g.16095 Transcript_12406/m.16095 type:complete len:436 (-) Transcript_12406:350-1657(-)